MMPGCSVRVYRKRKETMRNTHSGHFFSPRPSLSNDCIRAYLAAALPMIVLTAAASITGFVPAKRRKVGDEGFMKLRVICAI